MKVDPKFKAMLENRDVNNLTTAIIFGFATFNFFNTVGTMLIGDWFGAGSRWAWSSFWTALVVYGLLMIVAMWVHSMAKD